MSKKHYFVQWSRIDTPCITCTIITTKCFRSARSCAHINYTNNSTLVFSLCQMISGVDLAFINVPRWLHLQIRFFKAMIWNRLRRFKSAIICIVCSTSLTWNIQWFLFKKNCYLTTCVYVVWFFWIN
jgi:hypothetical protein